jgi:hypothetical protein
LLEGLFNRKSWFESSIEQKAKLKVTLNDQNEDGMLCNVDQIYEEH